MGIDNALPGSCLQGCDSVLIFRALQVGDMLCAVPAFRALRHALPNAKITLVGLPWAEAFARRFSCLIDRFIPFPGHPELPEQPADPALYLNFLSQTQAIHADLALQMHGSGEISNAIVARMGARRVAGFAPPSDMNDDHFFSYPNQGRETDRLLALTRFLGATTDQHALDFPITAEDQQALQATGLVQLLGTNDYVCLHPGARDRSKCWSVDCFAHVADELARTTGLRVVLTGSASERELTNAVAARMTQPVINAALSWSLGAMAALIQCARLLICNDSGVSHIAAALQVPSVVVFTLTNVERWAPANRYLHRCVRDPQCVQIASVIRQAQSLLSLNRDNLPRFQCRQAG